MNEFCKAAVLGILVLCRTGTLSAGPIPMPLKAQLDLASDVVVGRITKIIPIEENRGEGSHCGRVTVEVKETLKGRPANTLQFLAVTAIDPGWGGQEGFHECQVGDDGIWVIENGWTWNCGALPENEKEKIAQALKDLKERKWSQPVNGLRAWAAVTDSVIIFAVNNASKADLFVPAETEPGVVAATVTDQLGKVTRIVLRRNGDFDERRDLDRSKSEKAVCHTLSPGQATYFHPRYSSIDLSQEKQLALGKYSVVMSCKNDRTVGEAATAAHVWIPVAPWRGEVSAPAVELTIAAKPLSQDEIGEILTFVRRGHKLRRDTMHRALVSGQFYLRARAAQQLGDVGDLTSIPQLITALSDESEHVGVRYPDTGMVTTRYWANDSLKKLTKHDAGFRWDASKSERDAAIKRWNTWFETTGTVQENLKTAWKQVESLNHPLLAEASKVKPALTEDAQGLVDAEIEFVRNAVWEPKGPRSTSPDPMAIDRNQPFIFIRVSLYRPSPQSQPHVRTRTLRINNQDYSLLITVAASDLMLVKRVESILSGTFDRWRTDKPTSNLTGAPPVPGSP